jgi:hypothetical protein
MNSLGITIECNILQRMLLSVRLCVNRWPDCVSLSRVLVASSLPVVRFERGEL